MTPESEITADSVHALLGQVRDFEQQPGNFHALERALQSLAALAHQLEKARNPEAVALLTDSLEVVILSVTGIRVAGGALADALAHTATNGRLDTLERAAAALDRVLPGFWMTEEQRLRLDAARMAVENALLAKTPAASLDEASLLSPENLSAAIARLGYADEDEARRLTREILRLGAADTVPQLTAALGSASAVRNRQIAYTLGRLGNADALTALWRQLMATGIPDVREATIAALLAICEQLESSGAADSATHLISLLARAREEDSALYWAIAKAVAAIAERDPRPEMRAALPPLRLVVGKLRRGPFYDIYRRIDRATAPWKDLPIAAAAAESPDSATLPRPAAPRTPDAADLPRPHTEERAS